MSRTSNRNNSRRGFTLVELLVVIILIAMLSGMSVVVVRTALRSGKASTVQMQIHQLATALDMYKNKVGEYPPDNFLNYDELSRHIKKRWPRLKYDESTLRTPSKLYSGTVVNDVNEDGVYDAVDAFLSAMGIKDMTDATNASYASAVIFWLGGLPDGGDSTKPAGFYLSPTDPLGILASTDDRKQREDVFFSFPEKNIQTNLISGGFPCYCLNEQPVVYFRSTRHDTVYWMGSSDEIDRDKGQYAFFDTFNNNYTTVKWYDFGGDLGIAAPYAVRFKCVDEANDLNDYVWEGDETFQLIHPGEDGCFGTADNTVVKIVDTQENLSAADDDNITNFSEGTTLSSEYK